MQLIGAWVPTQKHISSLTSSAAINTMADVAALLLDMHHTPASAMDVSSSAAGPYPTSPNPEPPQDRYDVVSYTYAITSHEAKQAALDHYRGLGDAYAPPPKKDGEVPRDAPEDLAYYSLQAAYERNDASRGAGEALADEYERYCMQYDGDRDQKREDAVRTAPAEPGRKVCASCLRPFDDESASARKDDVVKESGHDYSKGKNSSSSTTPPVPASGVSFDVELGTWKVHFARNVEQEALHPATTTTSHKPAETAPEPPLDVPDGGYVGYHAHVLQGATTTTSGSSVLPVRAKEPPKSPDVPIPSAASVSAGKTAAAVAGDSDVMADYVEFLRGNDAVALPVAPQQAGDVVASYDEFLRANHVVVVSASAASDKALVPTIPAEAAVSEVEMRDEEGEEDEDMDYVDVRDEEYLDYLRANHVAVDVALAEQEDNIDEKMPEKKVETTGFKTAPVVNARATSYEDYFEFASNVGPYDGPRLG